MKKVWEYQVTAINTSKHARQITDHLNEIAANGWELVSVQSTDSNRVNHFFWKRKATSLEPDANIGLPTNQQYETILHPEPERKKSKLEVTNELEVGDTFPDFQLQSTSGEPFTLGNISGNVIVYFYAANGTEKCTIQARGFSLVYDTLTSMGFSIIGISPDNLDSHRKFKFEEGIPFNLLYDEGSQLCKRLGLLQREAPNELLPVRVTFLIDKNRKVIGKWDEFDVKTHSDDVVSFIMDIMDKT